MFSPFSFPVYLSPRPSCLMISGTVFLTASWFWFVEIIPDNEFDIAQQFT
jgi:hypothetical protein